MTRVDRSLVMVSMSENHKNNAGLLFDSLRLWHELSYFFTAKIFINMITLCWMQQTFTEVTTGASCFVNCDVGINIKSPNLQIEYNMTNSNWLFDLFRFFMSFFSKATNIHDNMLDNASDIKTRLSLTYDGLPRYQHFLISNISLQ